MTGLAGVPLEAGGGIALAVLLKATLILVVAWVLASFARRSSAAVRHGVWIAAVAAVTVLPIATPWLPPLEVELPAVLPALPAGPSAVAPAQAGATIASEGAVPGATTSATGGVPIRDARSVDGAGESARGPDWPILLLRLWLVGLVARFLWLGVQLLRVRRVVALSAPVGGASALAAGEAARELGVGRPIALLKSDRVATPVTCGVRRPVILLPVASTDWPPDRLRVVLLHEIAHIRRWDYLCCLLAELACALYWPVPLVWVARSAIQSEQEQASDDLVLASGASPVDYADHLLAIARSLRPGRAAFSATIGMAREVGLKRRIRTILDGRTPRAPLASLPGAATIAALVLCALPLAALRPVEAGRAGAAADAFDSTSLPAETHPEDTALAVQLPEAPQFLWLEAEEGVLRGAAEVGDDLDASEGHFVALIVDGSPGATHLSLHLPRAGSYRLWARVRREGEAVLKVSLDAGAEMGAPTSAPSPGPAPAPADDEGWQWIPVSGHEQALLPLDAGVHTLRLAVANGAARVDRLLATTDPDYVPASRGPRPEGFAPVFRWIDVSAGPLTEAAEFEVDLPAPGRYVLWGRVLGSHGEANSFFLSVDGGPDLVWDAPRRELGAEDARWIWDPASARDLAGRKVDPLVLELAAGVHTIRLAPRETGTGLAGLLVTNDLSYRPRGRTPGSPPVEVLIEPELAAPVQALRIRRGAGALGEGYLEAVEPGPERSEPGEEPPAELHFEVPQPGVYTIWARTVARRDTEDSFWIRVNDGPWVRWNGIPRSREWHWSAVHDGDGGVEPVQFALPAGENRIAIARREGGARLDRLLLTNEDHFDPPVPGAE